MDSVILFEVIPPVALSCVIIATKPVGGIKIGELVPFHTLAARRDTSPNDWCRTGLPNF